MKRKQDLPGGPVLPWLIQKQELSVFCREDHVSVITKDASLAINEATGWVENIDMKSL